MKTVGVFEARAHFSSLVKDALAGETIVITRNGEPVAELRPFDTKRQERARVALERIRAIRQNLKGPKINARELIGEGRR